MRTARTAFAGTALLALLAACNGNTSLSNNPVTNAVSNATAIDPADLQLIIDKSRGVVQEAERDPAFGASPQLLRETKAVVIIPDARKAAFVIGGQGGQGVILERNAGGWSYPAFVTFGAASAGFQIGFENADIVIFALSERAAQGLRQNEFKFGAEAGLTAATLGSNTELGSTPKLDADIIVWAKSAGVYAGLTVEGSVISVREQANADYYGRPVTTAQILDGTVSKPAADGLRRELPPR